MLSATDLAVMRAALDGSNSAVGAGLLPDLVDIDAKTETGRSAAGPTYDYTQVGRSVPCRFDPAETVERVINGRTVWVSEWPVWFRVGTAPTLGQVLNTGQRYEVVSTDRDDSWTFLHLVRVRRLEAGTL